MKDFNVLSLFDGMACGRMALDRLGVKIDNYYSSEIDKFAIKVAKNGYPDIITLGDVSNVTAESLLYINLLIGGSPCQDLRPGRDGLLGEKSKLFYEYYRLYKEIKAYNPDILFFFENTSKMKKEDRKIISNLLGVEPIELNSSLVSAQNRIRLYWTNIPYYGPPKDRKITLPDILDLEVDKKYNCSQKFIDRFFRRHSAYKGQINPLKTGTLNRKNNSAHGCIDNGTTLISVIAHSTHSRCAKGQGGKGPLYKSDGKSYCLDSSIGTMVQYGDTFRRLTPVECERLQTVTPGYTKCVSDHQAYIMLGNGWNVDTIVHLFEPLLWLDVI